MARSRNAMGKWRGRVGSTVFSVQNGKQVIREAPGEVRNPRSEKQLVVRARFKVGTQFVTLWKWTLVPYYRGRAANRVLARAAATRDAWDTATIAGSQAAIGIGAFGTRVNMTLGYQMAAPEVEFEAASKQIVVRDATVENPAMVVYEVRSFDAQGMPIGTRYVRTEVTSAEPLLVTLPISEAAVAKRYDLMTYYMREDPNAEDAGAYSRLTNLTVVDEETGELPAEEYTLDVLRDESAGNVLMSRLATGSFVVS